MFRLLTTQVFGKLLEPELEVPEPVLDQDLLSHGSGTDLKEHMVGILFSRSKLSHLQKQVCSHIVNAICKEAACMREDWELSLCSKHGLPDPLVMSPVTSLTHTALRCSPWCLP